MYWTMKFFSSEIKWVQHVVLCDCFFDFVKFYARGGGRIIFVRWYFYFGIMLGALCFKYNYLFISLQWSQFGKVVSEKILISSISISYISCQN